MEGTDDTTGPARAPDGALPPRPPESFKNSPARTKAVSLARRLGVTLDIGSRAPLAVLLKGEAIAQSAGNSFCTSWAEVLSRLQAIAPPPGEKRCSRCRARKPLLQFYVNNARRDGLASWCKACDALPRRHRATLAATMTVEEFAETLRISRAFAYILVKQGAVRSFRVGTRRLISADALSEFIAAREAESLGEQSDQ